MFRRFAIVLATAAVLVSCKGEKGDPGSTGAQGPSGAPDVVQYNGSVFSDDFTVPVSGNPGTHIISVSIGDGINYTESPYYLPSQSVNTYFLFRFNAVEIVNAQLAGASSYRVYLIPRNQIRSARTLADNLLER